MPNTAINWDVQKQSEAALLRTGYGESYRLFQTEIRHLRIILICREVNYPTPHLLNHNVKAIMKATAK